MSIKYKIVIYPLIALISAFLFLTVINLSKTEVYNKRPYYPEKPEETAPQTDIPESAETAETTSDTDVFSSEKSAETSCPDTAEQTSYTEQVETTETTPPETTPETTPSEPPSPQFCEEICVKKTERANDSYFEDALLIGDSRTYCMSIYGKLPGAVYYCAISLNVKTVLTEPFIASLDEKGERVMITLEEALKTDRQYGKIYFNFGLNELGWPSPQAFNSDYAELIRSVRILQPQAVIYIMGIHRISLSAESSGANPPYINNLNVDLYNDGIAHFSSENGFYFLDIGDIFRNENNLRYLDDTLTLDGIHLNKHGVSLVNEYIYTHIAS